jgi:hypothetical protein
MSGALSSLVRLYFCFVLGCISCFGQTEFSNRNNVARNQNPAGVNIILRTIGGKSAFHLFETIPIELVFQSSRPSTYSIELDEVMNFAGQANRLAVFPTDSVLLSRVSTTGEVVCCNTDRQYLSSQPTVLKRELTDYFRFGKPGTYSIYYATRRVFHGLGKPNDFGPSALTLTSNILTITILHDDPDWDSKQLADTLKLLSDARINAEYARALAHVQSLPSETAADFDRQNGLSQTELVRAQKALNALDTEEAIKTRVKLMKMNTPEDLDVMRKYHAWPGQPEPLLESTSRPDIMVMAMKARAQLPDFGVDYNFAMWWERFLMQLKHPEFYAPSDSVLFDAPDKKMFEYNTAQVAVLKNIADDLQEAVRSKKGGAAQLSTFTLSVINSLPGMPESTQ